MNWDDVVVSGSSVTWDHVFGLYVYDDGQTDTGIHDECLKLELIDILKTPDNAMRIFSGIAEEMRSPKAVESGYSEEEIASFRNWLIRLGAVM